MAEDLLTDDEQWEAIKHWTTENGPWLLGGVALGGMLLFGYRYYESHRMTVQLNAAAQFDAMTAAIDANDAAGARRFAGTIMQDYPSSPYADQAELMLARLSVDEGQDANAVEQLTRVMQNSKDSQLRHIARLRLARVLVDQGKPDEAISTLAAAPPGRFDSRYHEVRGDALYAKKDLSGALREYRAALEGGDPRGTESAVLELKIADLGAAVTPPAEKVKP
jgi:predicted negative regulator of RcsB-dependent stress response